MHLGANPDAGRKYSEKRKSEIWDSFRRVIGVCKKEQTELLLIAGDLFHRQPLLRELKEVDAMFASIPKTNVVLVAGNHDYLKKNSYYRTSSWSANVHMILDPEVTYIELPELDLAVYGCSYEAKENKAPLYERVHPTDDCRYRILLAHGGDAAHLPFRKSVVDQIGFDYVALGHIHKPEILVPNRMAYAGALEPIDRNDTGAHGWIRGELDAAGCRIWFEEQAEREYIHMDVPVEPHMTGYDLRIRIDEMTGAHGVQNMYCLCLKGQRDPDILFDLGQLDTFGNILEITDETRPAYDYGKLLMHNRGNLLGRYIESFAGVGEDSLEYAALCEGVQALLETRSEQI